MKKKYIMAVSLLAFIALMVGLTCYIVNDYNYKIEKNKIAVAKEKVELAKNTKNTDDINEAKKLIGEVDTEEVKDAPAFKGAEETPEEKSPAFKAEEQEAEIKEKEAE